MITEKVITEEVSLSPCCLYDAVKTLNDDGHSKRFPEGLHMSTIILIGLHALIWKYILGNWIVLPTSHRFDRDNKYLSINYWRTWIS